MGPLAGRLATPADPRCRRGKRHPFAAVLLSACSAVVTGARSFTAINEWAGRRPETSSKPTRALRSTPRAVVVRHARRGMSVARNWSRNSASNSLRISMRSSMRTVRSCGGCRPGRRSRWTAGSPAGRPRRSSRSNGPPGRRLAGPAVAYQRLPHAMDRAGQVGDAGPCDRRARGPRSFHEMGSSRTRPTAPWPSGIVLTSTFPGQTIRSGSWRPHRPRVSPRCERGRHPKRPRRRPSHPHAAVVWTSGPHPVDDGY